MSTAGSDVLDGAISPEANTALFGHEGALSFLSSSYRSGKGHHAMLIEGPEGIGKATLAFRFANHVLSNPKPDQAPPVISPPDPSSLEYRQIVAGASHNLLHLKRPVDEKTGRRKSAITVDEVRRTGRFFGQTSGNDNWRIVIVDAADDLNRNAANAVLKMLEEPPRKAMFLVLSHAPGRLLPTIRSRCLPLRLTPLDDKAMESALYKLGFEIPVESREMLLREANGSVSEALKLLNYGGIDILAALEDATSTTTPQARKAIHKVADVLSARDSETLYDFFTHAMMRKIEAKARLTALTGHLTASERWASLASSFSEQLATSEGYNLDRKQTVISLLESFAETHS